jgi:type IV secretion system protein VirB6
MACPPIITGDDFLLRTLAHIDCQAQVIGSYGYQALGQPGSTASTLVTGLLTVFVAFFGIRLLFGPPPAPRDVVYSVLRVGVVLTLAFSWPAFRTVIYDVTLKAPAEIASAIQTGNGSASDGGFAARLQLADNAMVRLTALGTGRNSGQLLESQQAGPAFAGTALQDDAAFGSGRLLYLSGVIGSLALLRVAAGLLLALAPLVAGLYFFTQSRGIFAGWLRGLVLTISGSVGATIILGVQLAIIEPWLADAIRLRTLGYAIPAAPTELFAIMLAFGIVQLVMIWLLAKVVFNRGWLDLPDFPDLRPVPQSWQSGQAMVLPPMREQSALLISRSERISNAIESSVRREQYGSQRRIPDAPSQQAASGQAGTSTPGVSEPPRLGSSYRRPAARTSRAARLRDGLS